MKLKSLLIAIFALIALGVPARAAYNNAISIDAISFLADGPVNFTFEFRTAPRNSVALSAAFDKVGDWSATVLEGQYRWYLPIGDVRATPLEGFSLGPWAALAYWSYKGASNFDNSADFLIGGEVAYKWVFDGFVLEPNIGFGFPVGDVSGLDFTSYRYFGARLGYAW